MNFQFNKFKKVWNLIYVIFLIIGYWSLVFLRVSKANAQSRLESPNFRIQFPNFNSGAGIPTSDTYNVNATIGQTAEGLFSSTGYIVRSGFQYIQTIIPFSFTVSDISIDFDDLIAGVATTQATTLTVKAGGAGGYSVKARENHPLQNDSGSTTIPDTTCDTGFCTQADADPWTLSTTYGFGFNMSGDDIPSDFVDSTYFRHFADASIPEDAEVIMNKSQVTWDYPNNAWPWESIADVTFKINISSTQAGGIFRNMVTFTAIPSF
jgi:hypothetical protein